MFIQFITIFGYVVLLVVGSEITFNPGCKFEVDTKNLVNISSQGEVISLTKDRNGTFYVQFEAGTYFTTECLVGLHRMTNTFQCSLGHVVRTLDGFQKIKELSCRNRLRFEEDVYRNGTCFNSYTNIEILLSEGDNSYTLASICHNEETSETLFVKSYIRGADLDEGETINRPSFKEAGFYPDISANDCYTQQTQFETIAEILGSENLASEYIKPEINLYLSRGHLSPNGDGIQAYEKKATFYFVNVVPQWQWINGGNWNQLEIRVRRIAEQRHSNLTIYTGAYGVTSLDDVNGNPAEIWLGRRNSGHLVQKLPVPNLLWKVIHDETRNDAVAVIMINNPFTTVRPVDILCEDVCNQLSWITWNIEDITLGYTYCCDVQSFANAIPYAPNLGSLVLLDEVIQK